MLKVGSFFYWDGRGVGKILSEARIGKVKVFFCKEGEKEVDKELLEVKARYLHSDSFKVLEGFYPEKLKRLIDNFSPELLKIIKNDYYSIHDKKVVTQIPVDFVRALIKPHFKDPKVWKKWWEKFRKQIKSTPADKETEQINFETGFPIIWQNFNQKVKYLSPDERSKFKDYFLKSVYNNDFLISFRSFLGLKQLKQKIPKNVIPHLKSILKEKATVEGLAFIKTYNSKEQEEIVQFIEKHFSLEDKRRYFLEISITPLRSRKAKETVLAELQKTETFISDLKDTVKKTKADAKDVIAGFKDVIRYSCKNDRQNCYDYVIEILPILFAKYGWKSDFTKLAESFRHMFIDLLPLGISYYGVLSFLKDLCDKCGNKEQAFKFFELVTSNLNSEKLKNLIFIFTFLNSLKKYCLLPQDIPISVQTGIKFLRKDFETWNTDVQRKMEDLIFNYRKLQQIKLGFEICDFANLLEKFKGSIREKLPEEESFLEWLVFVPSSQKYLKEILESWRRSYMELYSEFDKFKKMVESPEFIQKKTEQEINRQVLLKKEVLKESMEAELKRKKWEQIKEIALILCNLAYTISTMDVDNQVKDYVFNTLTKVAETKGYKIIGKPGEQVENFKSRYHELASGVSIESLAGKKLYVLYPGCVYLGKDGEVVLNKILVGGS